MDAEKRRYLFKEIGYEPHDGGQWLVHDSTSRFNIPCCGRRWGKTQVGGNRLTEAALDLEIPQGIYWIVGPSYALGEKEFRVLLFNLTRKLNLGHRIKKTYNVKQGDMRIEMPWGTVIEVKSADRKDSLIGEGLDGVVMAEAATHDVDTWQMYVEPALADKKGWALFPSTPRGYNWYHGLYMLGQMPDFPDYESWRFPSWSNTAVFEGGRDDPEIKRMERTMPPTTFQQEIAAEFTAYEGKIYGDFNPKVHVKHITYNPMWRNYLFLDYGMADPFVVLDVMIDPMDRAYVWREYQVSGLNTVEHAKVLKERENPDGYHVDGAFGDPRGADEESILSVLWIPVTSAVVPWKLGIEEVQKFMMLQPDGSTRLAIDPSCAHLIRQLERLHYKPVKGERNAREEQADYDDHGPDALRYGLGYIYVHGAGPRLSDIYTGAQTRSEAYAFFTQHSHITRD